MEAKKETIECRNCHEPMTILFTTANFATEVRVMNGKKSETRTYLKKCPNCETINKVKSDNKADWGKRKGPNMKLFMFSGVFGCLAFVVIGMLMLYFAFQGLQTIFDWLSS